MTRNWSITSDPGISGNVERSIAFAASATVAGARIGSSAGCVAVGEALAAFAFGTGSALTTAASAAGRAVSVLTPRSNSLATAALLATVVFCAVADTPQPARPATDI